MKGAKILSILKFSLLWLLTILVSIICLFLFHENGFQTSPYSLTIYDDDYLKSVLIMTIYAVIYIGWLYLIGILAFHFINIKHSLSFWYKFLTCVLITYAILLIIIYGFFQGQKFEADEITLVFLMYGFTSFFIVAFYNFLFKKSMDSET